LRVLRPTGFGFFSCFGSNTWTRRAPVEGGAGGKGNAIRTVGELGLVGSGLVDFLRVVAIVLY